MTDIWFIGGGGHALSCCELVNSISGFRICGVYDDKQDCQITQQNVDYCGGDDQLVPASVKNKNFVIAFGQVKSADRRKSVFYRLKKFDAILPNLISPYAVVSAASQFGVGVAVFHNCVVNQGAKVGDNCIINTGAIIEHGALIGSHCHVATSVVVNGDVCIGDGTFIGSGSIIKNGVTIGQNCVVQAGSIVLRDLPDGSKHYGS